MNTWLEMQTKAKAPLRRNCYYDSTLEVLQLPTPQKQWGHASTCPPQLREVPVQTGTSAAGRITCRSVSQLVVCCHMKPVLCLIEQSVARWAISLYHIGRRSSCRPSSSPCSTGIGECRCAVAKSKRGWARGETFEHPLTEWAPGDTPPVPGMLVTMWPQEPAGSTSRLDGLHNSGSLLPSQFQVFKLLSDALAVLQLLPWAAEKQHRGP